MIVVSYCHKTFIKLINVYTGRIGHTIQNINLVVTIKFLNRADDHTIYRLDYLHADVSLSLEVYIQ